MKEALYIIHLPQGTAHLCPTLSIPPREELQQVVTRFQHMAGGLFGTRSRVA
jgi:hypothetical protein